MTNVESEYILEENLIKKLIDQGYKRVFIKNEDELKNNLKKQLEEFNNITLSSEEFEKVYNELNVGDNFQRAQTLRNKSYKLKRDGKIIPIKYFNSEKWCDNLFQVANQITMVGERTNRYDVTILINGLPMIQIELKRRGGELGEAFRQINRYKKESFKNLFKFIQIFIISTGNETKYFSTNEDSGKHANKKFAFTWTDKDNNPINSLLTEENGKESFVQSFLKRCQIGKMIAKYMIISKNTGFIKILRPYQFYAVEAILDRIENSKLGGFVWHTTGSGKTLTSFKAAQEIKNTIKKIDKVFFVVDRRDLNSQTLDEFRDFDSDEDIFDTKNTNALVKKIESNDNELVVTTLQKFDRAIKKLNDKYPNGKQESREKNVVFIFDECHRSQFGETNKLIRKYFKNNQMIGFTGTPIKAANNNHKQTTNDLFDNKSLHEYKISEAITDNNVLGFSIEYFKTYDLSKSISVGDEISTNQSINRKEVLEHPQRIKNIVENIFKIHDLKTFDREFNAMFTVSNIKLLKKYYDEFKRQNALLEEDKKLKVVSIFSVQENDDEGDGEQPNKEMLYEVINDYSKLKNKEFSTTNLNWYNTYRVNLIKSVKDNNVDIVLVVNMLTTGFDAPTLNTLYVDKNLEYHGLLQAFSRTNRLYNEKKKQGNIVVYSRPNKQKVDESISEFSSNAGLSLVLKESYEHYVEVFNKLFKDLTSSFENHDYVSSLKDEEQKVDFVKKFRELASELNILKTFFQFDFEDIDCDVQTFENYSEVYRRMWKEQQESKDKISIVNEVDFKIELLSSDKIDQNYIKKLLEGKKEEFATPTEYRKVANDLVDKLNRHSNYPQKLIDLIRVFIDEQNEKIEDKITFGELLTYDLLLDYLNEQKKNQLNDLIKRYNLDNNGFEELIKSYEMTSGFSHILLKDLVPIMKEKAKEENQKPFIYKRKVINDLKEEITYIYLNTQLEY